MRLHDLRLAPAALACIVSSVAGVHGASWWLLAGIWIVAALAGLGIALLGAGPRRGPGRVDRSAWLRARRWTRDVSVAVALAAAVAAAMSASAGLRGVGDAPEWSVGRAQGSTVALGGTVASEPRQLSGDPWTGSSRCGFELRADGGGTAWVVVSGDGPDAGGQAGREPAGDAVVDGCPGLGDRVEVSGSLGSTGSDGVASVWDASIARRTGPAGPDAVVAAVRSKGVTLARAAPGEVGPVTLGMVTGDTALMSKRFTEAMRVVGLTHLTAVSGSHFAVVLVVLAWALRSLVPWRPVRAVALAGTMAMLALVVLLEPSVVRALTMALAVAMGWWLGRPARAIASLSAGTIILTVLDPSLGAELGFQLSVAAVAAIVLWAPAIAQSLERFVVAPLAKAISVPFAAWLACLPLLVSVWPGVGTFTVVANLVAAPCAAWVTVVGMGALAVGLLHEPAGEGLMTIASAGAYPIVWVAEYVSAAPMAWLAWPPGWLGVALALAGLGLMVAATTARRTKGWVRAALAILALGVGLATSVFTPVLGPVLDDWSVVVCDVGQGDMMLVRSGEHAAVVIDTGPPGGAGVACLDRYGVQEVPLLVLTHPHADHDGAFGELNDSVMIGQVWASAITFNSAVAGSLEGTAVGEAMSAGVPAVPAVAGMTFSQGSAKVEVLLAPAATEVASDSSAVNDASVVVLAQSSGVVALGLGDLELDGQDRLLALVGGGLVVDVIKVAHHGSAVQNDALASAVTARVAAISVGADNPYGHPARSTVDLYGQGPGVVLTTAECGDIALGPHAQVASRCGTDVAG